MSATFLLKSFVILTAVAAPALSLRTTGRTTISLNGTWQIEDSKEADAIRVAWNHKVPVPGLRIRPNPHFQKWISSKVDQFDSRMLIQNRVSQGKVPKSAARFTCNMVPPTFSGIGIRNAYERIC